MYAGIAAEVLLYDFGYYTFSVYWRNSKHDTLLYGLGDNLHEVIQNLNALHHHLSSKYDKMIAPSFTCDVEPDGLVVHYHSYRPKLGEYVRGILIGLASHVYRLNVRIESLEHKRLSSGEGLNYYYKFKITLNGLRDEGTLLSKFSESNSFAFDNQSIYITHYSDSRSFMIDACTVFSLCRTPRIQRGENSITCRAQKIESKLSCC